MTEDPPPVVAAHGVAKTYSNGTEALAPVDLAVAPGEFVTLLGPSGCGKSTLLNLIAGLATPSAGSLAWWGAPSSRSTGPERRIGCVFQSPTLMPWSRVATNVRLPLDLEGRPRADADAAVVRALEQVGIGTFAHHLPRELSGGMQMRASIARALAGEPDLLLMDEPFGALDEFTRQRLDSDLRALWAARGLTIVFVTHSIQEAVFLSTRVLVMGARPGRILASRAIDEAHPRGEQFRASTRFAQHSRALSDCVMAAGAGAFAPA